MEAPTSLGNGFVGLGNDFVSLGNVFRSLGNHSVNQRNGRLGLGNGRLGLRNDPICLFCWGFEALDWWQGFAAPGCVQRRRGCVLSTRLTVLKNPRTGFQGDGGGLYISDKARGADKFVAW